MVGKLISHYRVVERLGGGGMGVVYRAEDTRLKRPVALKFLPPELTQDAEAKQRFIHEAQAASALQHTNICVIHDIEQIEDRPADDGSLPRGQMFIVMEYYGDETLKNRLEHGPLSTAAAVRLATQIASGLAKAHAHGIVHRDIKPSNIVITEDGVAKILDFGLAKLVGQAHITRVGSTVGTIAYMSPEQARGEDVDQRTDIWSLGVVLYEMLTGRLPFPGEFEQGIIYSILNVDPKPLRSFNPGLSGALERIVSKALEKDRTHRYSSFEEMFADLTGSATAQASEDTSAHPLATTHRPSTLRWIVPAGIVLIGIAAYLFSRFGLPWARPEVIEGGVATPQSITVLPLQDYSPNNDQAYFCNGIADEIVSALSQIPELKIVSGTRAFALGERKIDFREMGKLLGVTSVLEGSVRKADNQLRITMYLTNVADGSQVWTQAFDRRAGDIIGVQEDVARSVAATLKITLAPQTAEKMLPRQTNNPEAYQYFLRGNYLVKLYLVSYREQDIQSAIRMFESAIALDSTYALAYGGLAWAYEHRFVYSRYKETTDREHVLQSLRRAYELDPRSGPINAGMGYVAMKTGEFDRAVEFYRNAIAIDPHSLWVNHLTGDFLFAAGLPEQACRFFVRAIEKDPYYLFALGELAACYEYLGEYDKAAAFYKRALTLSPNDRIYKSDYITFLFKAGKTDQAAAVLDAAIKAHPEFAGYAPCKALLFAFKGKRREALSVQKSAAVYAVLRMRSEALHVVEEKAGTDAAHLYINLLHNPFFDNIRNDPQFQSILAQQKLVYEERLKKYGNL